MRGRRLAIAPVLVVAGCNALTGLDKNYTESAGSTGSYEAGAEVEAGPDGTTTTPVCSTDADCRAKAPPTTPPYCAVGTCDVANSVCVFSAPDDDGDGFTASNCVSTNGVPVTNTGDCDDHDPGLYPGHSEECMPEYDDAGPDAGYCVAGQVSCLVNGTKSACSGTCTLCDPMALGCNGQQPQQCDLSGTSWVNVGAACVNQACVDGACVGSCAPGTTQCGLGATSTQTCDATGNWLAAQACTEGPSPGCSSGVCNYTLVSGQVNPGGIAVDATSLYWTVDGPNGSQSEAAVLKISLGGGTPVTLASGLPRLTSGIAMEATRVYWTTTAVDKYGFDLPDASAVVKMSLDGGTPSTLVAQQNLAADVVVNGLSAYWTAGPDLKNRGMVVTVPLGGGTPTTLASGQDYPGGLSLDETSVYWVIHGDVETSVDAGAIMKMPLDGGTPVTLAWGNLPAETAVDSTSIYWTDSGNVLKMPLGGGTPTTLASGQGKIGDMALDATNVYWTTVQGGTVMKVPLGGGTPTTLASGASFADAIAVDATHVYWTEDTSGNIMFAPK